MAVEPIEILRTAVSLRLGELYPGVKVYDEKIKQHLPDESFVLYVVPGIGRPTSLRRFTMPGTLDIAYIIRDDSDEAKLKKLFYERYTNIMTGMKYLVYDESRVRLQDFQYQEADNVLHILCTFELQIFTEETDAEGL